MPQMHSRWVISFLSLIASSCSSVILLFEYSSAEMYLGLLYFCECWLVYLWERSLFRSVDIIVTVIFEYNEGNTKRDNDHTIPKLSLPTSLL